MIEELRNLLHLCIDIFGAKHELTVTVSQLLDEELNKEGIIVA